MLLFNNGIDGYDGVRGNDDDVDDDDNY